MAMDENGWKWMEMDGNVWECMGMHGMGRDVTQWDRI